MAKFIFTYGTNPDFPFEGGWTEIEAPNDRMAAEIFQTIHPNRSRDDTFLNCAFVYPEETFKETKMYKDSNFGGRCHERVTFEGCRENLFVFRRELLDAEYYRIPDPSGGRHADEN